MTERYCIFSVPRYFPSSKNRYGFGVSTKKSEVPLWNLGPFAIYLQTTQNCYENVESAADDNACGRQYPLVWVYAQKE
jgi:hypothetical protein